MKRIALLLILLALSANAANLTLPTATLKAVDASPASSVRLPTTPWSPGTTPPEIEGAIRRTVLQVPGAAMTTLQLLGPLRKALTEDGYAQIFTCADAACGGFDFRFQLDLLGEPDMHVDLGNYRYLLMEKSGAEPHTVALVASSTNHTGLVHVTEVSRSQLPETVVEPTPTSTGNTPALAVQSGDLISTLVSTGRAILSDLEFETGSAELSGGPFTSLSTLSDWLLANSSARIVLVGHTDAVGSLEANTTLSHRRAVAVTDRLTRDFDTNPNQLQAAGAGYLAPMGSNLTAEGRTKNRRVEVVLLSVN